MAGEHLLCKAAARRLVGWLLREAGGGSGIHEWSPVCYALIITSFPTNIERGMDKSWVTLITKDYSAYHNVLCITKYQREPCGPGLHVYRSAAATVLSVILLHGRAGGGQEFVVKGVVNSLAMYPYSGAGV